MTDTLWAGWWVVRWGQRLTHIEADNAEDAIHGSIDALRGLGDWTEDPGELSAFPYVEFGKHSIPRDFTRAVIDRKHRAKRNPGRSGARFGRGRTGRIGVTPVRHRVDRFTRQAGATPRFHRLS